MGTSAASTAGAGVEVTAAGTQDSEGRSLASSCVQSGETKKPFSKWRIQGRPRQSVGREA